MASYSVRNLDNPLTEGDYPGIHITASSEAAAAAAYANGPYGWAAGHRLRVIPVGPNSIVFFVPQPGPAVPGSAVTPPALPPVGS